jgi:hypothetical protein
VDVGHVFQVQLGDKMREIVGPAMVRIVNNDSSQPVPLQLTAPAPGQYVQQLLDEHGMLAHLIISSSPTAAAAVTAAMPLPSQQQQHLLDQQHHLFQSHHHQPLYLHNSQHNVSKLNAKSGKTTTAAAAQQHQQHYQQQYHHTHHGNGQKLYSNLMVTTGVI